MSCLECDTPGFFPGSGLCRTCQRECLGIDDTPQPGRCAGLECGARVAQGERYCPDCHDEIYGDDDWYSEDDAA